MAPGSYTLKDLDVEVMEDSDNKYFCSHYAKKLFKLLFEAPIYSKLLKTFEDTEEKEHLQFYKMQKQNVLTVMQNYFSEQKNLTKLNFEQFINSFSKTEQKISKKE